MSYELKITRKAKHEVTEAYSYYEKIKPGLGENFFHQIEIYFKIITISPEQFPQKRKPFSETNIQKFPFLIIYEIIENNVVVYSVFNTWQNPEKKVQ